MIPKHLPRTFSPLAVLAAVAALWGCGHPVQETAAHKIADALPSVLGPAAHYDVQVDGDPFALARGRARGVHIQGLGVQVSPKITLDTLSADAEDVSFDTKTRHLSHVGATRFTATMDQEHLSNYLAQSKPLLPGLVVTLQESDVVARVPVTFLGLHTTAALAGTFAPNADDPSRLDFVTQGAQIGVVPLPAGLVNLAVDTLNPVISLTGLKAPLTITRSGVEHGRLILQGSANLDGLVHE